MFLTNPEYMTLTSLGVGRHQGAFGNHRIRLVFIALRYVVHIIRFFNPNLHSKRRPMAATGSHSTVSARSADSQLLLEQRLYRIGYQSRKALPIKRNDGEPLTRADIQFDLLEAIFTDNHKVFTSHNPSHAGQSVKLAFAELYTAAIYNSTKCSKVLKEKMVETPAFATELAKLSLCQLSGRHPCPAQDRLRFLLLTSD